MQTLIFVVALGSLNKKGRSLMGCDLSSLYFLRFDLLICNSLKTVFCLSYSINRDLYGTGKVRSPYCDIIQWSPFAPMDSSVYISGFAKSSP